MATYKGVWFSESDPTKWFEEADGARQFDKAAEVVAYLRDALDEESQELTLPVIVKRMMERYTISERYDYVPPHTKASDEPKEGDEG